MTLESRYIDIQKNLEALPDFSEEKLAESRALFNLETIPIIPQFFEVWTCLVGLPIPESLMENFQNIVTSITAILPSSTRFYQVIPTNYHWELFIIKRPDEEVSPERLHEASDILKNVLSQSEPLTISYRGFLVTPDGTIIVKGYGNFDNLRQQLSQKIPFASPKQSSIGHISLGRILDPIGKDNFTKLKEIIKSSANEFYGELKVTEAKYVHETQWYMEKKAVITKLAFCSDQ